MNESTLVSREEMSDLDWLARNVHEWPDGKEECLVVLFRNPYPIWGVCKSNCGWIVRSEWLARRAELQNKPSWNDAPEWVGWLAQDKSGAWWFFRCHPKAMSEGWDSDSSAYHHSSWVDGEVLGDWRDTLEKRPEQSEFEPFVSVEDAATAKQHDPVNSPPHYASCGIECIDAIKASMSHEAFLGYLKGNVQKYTWRYEKKVNPAEDLKKAQWYLSKLIDEQFS